MNTSVLDSHWHMMDYLGAFRVRIGYRRNHYSMEPGLYRLGNPSEESPVFVTANYKLSVDHLRRGLKGLDSWILVLNTKGINVWCAAGKGTFGTDELINRVKAVSLDKIVTHRTLILPQLGAPGMTPRKVSEGCGFKIQYGPVEAKDIRSFMDNGQKATPEMRRKNFPLTERLAVSLTHFSQGLASVFGLALIFILLDRIVRGIFNVGYNSVLSLSALFIGSLLAGALLPIIPGRAFSLKGFFIGLSVYPLVFLADRSENLLPVILYLLGKALILHCVVVYQVLNLTGSSTYTSLSGVRKEMSIAIPLLIFGAASALALLITGGILL